MEKKTIKGISYIIFFLLLFSCSGGTGIREFKNKNNFERSADSIRVSQEKIEKEVTYEIYFTLEKSTDCIRVELSSSHVDNPFTGKKEPVKAFFIVEQIIDVSRFTGQKENYVYSEMGRNFDTSWNSTRELTLCSSKYDPILRFREKTFYRLRFSIFKSFKSDYSISVHADCKVFYHDKPSISPDVPVTDKK